MDIREKIAEWLYHNGAIGGFPREESWDKISTLRKKAYIKKVDRLLSLETDTERIGVYLKEPVLPENPYPKENSLGRANMTHMIYCIGRNDILKANFVQLKEGE